MTTLGVLVVDDEPLARETLVDLVARAPGVELAGECANGVEARQRLADAPPDIVLLDIEMPGLRGVDLVAALPEERRPAVVFVTAHAEHALQAFALRAVDYLLKPYSDERFFEVIEGARQRVLEHRVSRAALELLAEMPGPVGTGARGESPASSYLDRIAVKRRDGQVLVPVDAVRWIESDDYCVRLHTRDGRHLLRCSLATLEGRLDPALFVRVHRSAIVRIGEVQRIRRRANGGRELELSQGERIPISRARAREVETRLVPRLEG